MIQKTEVLIRVQANGGKFLGPDIGYSLVTIRNAVSGELLAQGLAAGGSGQLLEHYEQGASRSLILTPGSANQHAERHWLAATPGQPTAGLRARSSSRRSRAAARRSTRRAWLP
ncbi:MAG: hypothetical protein HC897_18165, partial [Thermoanaerobaculia bacterium]|nr:hypothetical protein [Thermoanaerobaculia bacterium]